MMEESILLHFLFNPLSWAGYFTIIFAIIQCRKMNKKKYASLKKEVYGKSAVGVKVAKYHKKKFAKSQKGVQK